MVIGEGNGGYEIVDSDNEDMGTLEWWVHETSVRGLGTSGGEVGT